MAVVGAWPGAARKVCYRQRKVKQVQEPGEGLSRLPNAVRVLEEEAEIESGLQSL